MPQFCLPFRHAVPSLAQFVLNTMDQVHLIVPVDYVNSTIKQDIPTAAVSTQWARTYALPRDFD